MYDVSNRGNILFFYLFSCMVFTVGTQGVTLNSSQAVFFFRLLSETTGTIKDPHLHLPFILY